MKRRGRPTVAAQHLSESFSQTLIDSMPDKTSRTMAAVYYRTAVFSLLSEAASNIPYLDGIYHDDDVKMEIRQMGEITEQLGRMLVQDGYSKEDVLEVAKVAAQAYHEGCTVKQIKAWILKVRKDGTY